MSPLILANANLDMTSSGVEDGDGLEDRYADWVHEPSQKAFYTAG